MEPITTNPDTDAPQTAMLLTESEWRDLAFMLRHYLDATSWVEDADLNGVAVNEKRERSLAQRIIEAAS